MFLNPLRSIQCRLLSGSMLAVMVVILFANTSAMAKQDPPIVTQIDLLELPEAGQDCVVFWEGIPFVEPNDAEITFRVIGENGMEKATQKTRIRMIYDEVSSYEFAFHVEKPGNYQVFVGVTIYVDNGQFAKEDVILLHVPPTGRARIVEEEVLSAARMMERAKVEESREEFIEDQSDSKSTLYATAGFEVRGYIRYTDRTYTNGAFTGTQMVPARRVKVEIRDSESVGSELLGQTTTSNDGYFTFWVPNNDDGSQEGGRDIFVRVLADSSMVRVEDTGGNTHFYDTPTHGNWPGGTLDIGTEGNIPLANSGPWNIHDVIVRGYDYAQNRGESPPKVTCRWAPGNTDGTHYHDSLSRIDILGTTADPDEFDDDVLLHEYGHFCGAKMSYGKSPGGTHSWTDHISKELAWSEGWAHFFSSAVRNYEYQVDHTQSSFGQLNLELPTGNVTGADCEGAVAASLWDIYDSNSDLQDRLSDGVANVWRVFTHSTYFSSTRSCVMDDFVDGWVALNCGHLMELSDILSEHDTKDRDVTYPSASGVKWNRGSSYNITWSGFSGSNVKIELYKGGSLNTTISSSTANDGTEPWTVPSGQTLGTDYKIKITSTSDTSKYDYSDNNFEIYQPAVPAVSLPYEKEGTKRRGRRF